MKWNKSEIAQETVRKLCEKYGVDTITASIMARRGLTEGNDVWPFTEKSTRYLHNPFLFNAMEDAVDRILDAVDEEGGGEKPKVLVFGDRDVDGVTATIIMTNALKEAGCDVSYRLPVGDEPYGLSVAAVDDFAEEGGTLIVTVDCGISAFAAVEKAAEYGIDVIITDHHNALSTLPEAAAIINPKVRESGYPFAGLSGAAVALKVSYALHFSRLAYYKSEITLLDAYYTDERVQSITVECIKTRNMVITDRFSKTFHKGEPIANSTLADFLQGQYIFVWDAKKVSGVLKSVFGNSAEFALTDFRADVAKTWEQFTNRSLEEVRSASRVSVYGGGKEIADALYNIFVTWMLFLLSKEYKNEEDDLCLASLSTMADIMPLMDENRIIIKAALSAINSGKVRRGLSELFAYQAIMANSVTARDLSWTVIPALNAAGRMGRPQTALELLASEDAMERETLAKEIVSMNEERKRLVSGALFAAGIAAKQSLEENDGKLIIVVSGKIAKGVTGLVASKLTEQYEVPSIAASISNGTVTGSIRGVEGFSCTQFLSMLDGFFIDYGGHNLAAGFSMQKEMLDSFKKRIKEAAKGITIQKGEDAVNIDAEIPPQYIGALLKVVDFFSPFGTGNAELLFMTRSLTVCNAIVMGKTERQHLKLTLDCGKAKYPAIIWGGAELLDSKLHIGESIDILYSMTRNTYNGIISAQMIIKDWKKSQPR